MPTYTNDSNATRVVTNSAHQVVHVAPGESVSTYDLLTAANWTKTTDSPYYNHVLAVTQPTGSDDATVTLQANTDRVEIYNVSSYTVSCYINAKANTPARLIPSGSVISIPERSSESSIKDRISALVLSFGGIITAGQVNVTEFEDQ